ncbi:LysR family transcriptional regulator [Bdellovibrio bacteriovorus]|uniref:LysR family transcriptional regulator n=1 Tax=Bdellovibrio bacteriovorus TaxID=959 RepID=UPI003CFDC599
MKYKIRDIENFVHTSTCTTIIQAAQKLEISQPALSESLKRLESDLGTVLFYRSRSGIQLTPSGRVFLGKAQRALQSLQELDFDADHERVFAGRTVTIGCHMTVAQYSIPRAVTYLKERAPDYKIELRHDLSRSIQMEIQKGNIDIGVVINPAEVPDLVIHKMAQDTVGVWSAKNEAHDTIICNLNLFQTQSILKKWKDRPEKVISTDSLELICKMVHERIGYGIIPGRAVEMSGLSLKSLPQLPSFKDQISLVYRPEFGKIPAEKLVIEALKHSILGL